MEAIKQGEKLMLLVRRDPRSTEQLAELMGIDKSYFPKLYKMDKLPRKPLQRAMEVLGVPVGYFEGENSDTNLVSEPVMGYRNQLEIEKLGTENEALRLEINRLEDLLERERAISANLAEALKNLSSK